MMPRSLDQIVAHAEELAGVFEAYEPDESDRGEPPLVALRRAAYQRARIEQQLLDLVRGARESGASWKQVGQELGTTGEAARQRYGRHIRG
jgi:hypothetical protein